MGAHKYMKRNESNTSERSFSGGNQLALVMPFCRPQRYRKLYTFFSSILGFLPLCIVPCRLVTPPSGSSDRKYSGSRVIGTLFGNRKGHVHYAVQDDPKLPPILLLELATPTSSLVKEMSSGLMRITLECEKTANTAKLIQEPFWRMFCNGRKAGYAMKKACSETELHILSLLQAISMGAGVLPTKMEGGSQGELMYMRARFERVVGSKDSEAFYMMNSDGTGSSELSIFLLRI